MFLKILDLEMGNKMIKLNDDFIHAFKVSNFLFLAVDLNPSG